MESREYLLILLALACIVLFVAGCTTTTTIGNPAPAPAAQPAPAAAAAPAGAGTVSHAAPVAAATTPSCPDKEVLTGSWDSREVGYASNHDVRETGVWTDASPVPVTLAQTCWDVTGTYMVGDCPGTLTGKIGKNVFSGKFDLKCTNTADSKSGAFTVAMAADNQSFMGMMYDPTGYGPDAGFPPSWWAKKTS
jgi:hypothetical protein